jgi:hypothetical protein
MSVILRTLLIGSLATGAWAASTFTSPGFENLTPTNLGGWILSSTDWNCLANNTQTKIVGCEDPSGAAQNTGMYVHGGNQGIMLGYGEPSVPATLTQILTVTRTGNYRVSFWYREHESYPSETTDNLLEVVYRLAGTTNWNVAWSRSDARNVGWTSVTSAQMPLTGSNRSPNTYEVGFLFYNAWGEWALDDTDFYRNPEPGTLALIAAPLAWVMWRRRRA